MIPPIVMKTAAMHPKMKVLTDAIAINIHDKNSLTKCIIRIIIFIEDK
jgi:hypothetical protein